jgi:hypothetical protein
MEQINDRDGKILSTIYPSVSEYYIRPYGKIIVYYKSVE